MGENEKDGNVATDPQDLRRQKTQDLPAKSPSSDDGDGAEAKRIGGNPDESVRKNIDLEVMELRASLQSQGLFRDAIEDICNEKRQRLLEEHQQGNMATLASPDRKASEDPEDGADEDSSDASEVDVERERQKAAALAAAAGSDRDRQKPKAKLKSNTETLEQKEKDREKEKKVKDGG